MVVGLTLIGFVQAKDTGKGKCTLLYFCKATGRADGARSKSQDQSEAGVQGGVA